VVRATAAASHAPVSSGPSDTATDANEGPPSGKFSKAREKKMGEPGLCSF
jgi:hypothetical protein